MKTWEDYAEERINKKYRPDLREGCTGWVAIKKYGRLKKISAGMVEWTSRSLLHIEFDNQTNGLGIRPFGKKSLKQVGVKEEIYFVPDAKYLKWGKK